MPCLEPPSPPHNPRLTLTCSENLSVPQSSELPQAKCKSYIKSSLCNCMSTYCAFSFSEITIIIIRPQRVSSEKKEDLITSVENCTDWFSSQPRCARTYQCKWKICKFFCSAPTFSGRIGVNLERKKKLNETEAKIPPSFPVRGKAGGSASRVREGTVRSLLSTPPLGQAVPLCNTVLWPCQLFCTAASCLSFLPLLLYSNQSTALQHNFIHRVCRHVNNLDHENNGISTSKGCGCALTCVVTFDCLCYWFAIVAVHFLPVYIYKFLIAFR